MDPAKMPERSDSDIYLPMIALSPPSAISLNEFIRVELARYPLLAAIRIRLVILSMSELM